MARHLVTNTHYSKYSESQKTDDQNVITIAANKPIQPPYKHPLQNIDAAVIMHTK